LGTIVAKKRQLFDVGAEEVLARVVAVTLWTEVVADSTVDEELVTMADELESADVDVDDEDAPVLDSDTVEVEIELEDIEAVDDEAELDVALQTRGATPEVMIWG